MHLSFSFGLSLNEFWGMRPKDFFLMSKARGELRKEQNDFQIILTREILAFIHNNGEFYEGKQGLTGSEIWSLESDVKNEVVVKLPTKEEIEALEKLINGI